MNKKLKEESPNVFLMGSKMLTTKILPTCTNAQGMQTCLRRLYKNETERGNEFKEVNQTVPKV